MAPEIALEALGSLPIGSMVLDPMCGSGTVLREALRRRHRAVGFDLDPLAVLISRVSTQQTNPAKLTEACNAIADEAIALREKEVSIPWIDGDAETRRFVEFWFAPEQRRALRALASLVSPTRGHVGDALKLAISKTIITKEPRASLARDTSHSRPHRVATTSDYDVVQGFRRAVAHIATELQRDPPAGSAKTRRADARRLPSSLNGAADIVVTSPPYGNAIDYLRGHRLSLVWLGYTIPQLRAIRNKSIGSESGFGARQATALQELARQLGPIDELDSATRLRLHRFAGDMRTALSQIQRALKPRGRAVLVVGNSTVRGVFLDNTRLIGAAAQEVGLKEMSRYSRQILANHRYLPPPEPGGDGSLGKRMREEIVLTFEKKS
jgi:DNA modification methylase